MHPFKSITWTRISEWVILLPQNPLKTFSGDDWLLYFSLHLSVLELYYSKGIINTSDRIIVSFFFFPTAKSLLFSLGVPANCHMQFWTSLLMVINASWDPPTKLPHHLCCQCQLLLEKPSHLGPGTPVQTAGSPNGTVAPRVCDRVVGKLFNSGTLFNPFAPYAPRNYVAS